MGLFGSKKTYVSSTIYNMAGPIEDRPNFLKTLLTGNALGTSSGPLSDQIQTAYLNGPGLKLRSFGRWSEDEFDIVSVPRANLYSRVTVPSETVSKYIPTKSGGTINVLRVEAKLGDYAFWAEQWMLQNRPGTLSTDWVSDYDEVANTIRITFSDGTMVSFQPNDFRKSSAYIYVVYAEVTGQEPGPINQGVEKDLNEGEPFPSVTGWDRLTVIETPQTVQLQKIVHTTKSYSDGRPDEVSTTSSVTDASYTYIRNSYSKTTYNGAVAGSGQITSTRQYMYQSADGIVDDTERTTTSSEDVDGVTVKTTIKTVEEYLSVKRSYRVDNQTIIIQTTSDPALWIYRFGSGNAELDGLVNETQEQGFYYPFIPVRLDNKFLSEINPEAYEKAVKAYRKATTGKLDDVQKGLQDNKDLKDIDYAYVMFGVSLNTKEMVGKKYLYGFFDKLRLTQDTTTADYQLWRAQQQAFLQSDAQSIAWQQGQSDPSSPYYNTPAPQLGDVSAIPTNEIRIRGNGSLQTNLDIQISWQAISRITGSGQGRAGAKKGDYWLDNGTTDAYAQSLLVNGSVLPIYNQATDRLVIHHQIDDNSWESLTIIGLVHKNFIYNGKFVEIKSKEAMEDKEESGFLVPLHYQTFKEMGLKDSTQLSTACCYMVINSYLVKKTGFFSSIFFKIILVVAIIAVTVATGGIGGASAGLLGANAAVGAAIGLTGTLAVIAGAVANAVVAMLLSKIISIGATAVFGEKLGAIIGAIASVVAMQVGTSLINNQSLASAFQNLTKVDSILALTNAAGNGIAGYIQGEAIDTLKKTQKLMDDYNRESEEITEKFAQEFGYGRAEIDVMGLSQRQDMIVETLDSFLERTLMTGSDVAELSTNLISRFTQITLSTELP